ncbi:MAG: hypothetical protein PHQ54_04135, partial [Candidatus Omnitrophica bacterium]|nr:hypothetical protein [Candidatus Omnitrophota bacterium]
VNQIYLDPSDHSLVYIAADSGLAITEDGEHFETIFNSSRQGIKCLSLIRQGATVYLGTDSGLYFADAGVYDFKKVSGLPENIKVFWLEHSQPFLYLATDMGLYRTENGKYFKRTFVISRQDSEASYGEEGSYSPEVSGSLPQIVRADKKDSKIVYLGTTDGLFISNDYGTNFRKSFTAGLGNLAINSILADSIDPLFVATDKGFFKVYAARGSAIKVYEGLPTDKINHIAIDKRGRLYLATSKGLFEEGEDSQEFIQRHYDSLCFDEPSAQEVQKAAVDYNEVSPEKIRAWRNSLRYRALLPQFKLGYDKTVTTALGATYDKVQIGPKDWSIDFTWDLDNLIWNHYQDDVDTRSRLNTQLRIDILDEVNRIYFARKKVKMDLLGKPPSNSAEHIKQMMYLEELTAALDAYTGGFFSRRVEELKSQNRR